MVCQRRCWLVAALVACLWVYQSRASVAWELPSACEGIRRTVPAARRHGPLGSSSDDLSGAGDSIGSSIRRGSSSCGLPVKNFVILGERNSGTNYVSQLIKENVVENSLNYLDLFPKHWNPSEYDTTVPKHTLFILVTRNPYDWLVSMHDNCYCCEKMMSYPLKEYFTMPYQVDDNTTTCPSTEGKTPGGQPISSMMALRTLKLQMHMYLGMAYRPYFVTVRLEDLWCAENPAAWLQDNLADFCLEWEPATANIQQDARDWLGTKFKLKEKFDVSWYFNRAHVCEEHGAALVHRIGKELSRKLEHHLGYSLIKCITPP